MNPWIVNLPNENLVPFGLTKQNKKFKGNETS
jgi:hypothetical protein